MHCNLRQPDAAQSLSALISSPVPRLKSLSLSDAVLECFPADTIRYAVTLTFDLEPSWCIVCDLMKLSAEFERNRKIRGGVIVV